MRYGRLQMRHGQRAVYVGGGYDDFEARNQRGKNMFMLMLVSSHP
jgi:hypothetical protein